MTDIQNKKVLVVEDEQDLAELIKDYLTAAHYDAHIINDGLEADTWLKENTVDLVLLDLMLPNKSGLDICRDYRKTHDTPIIMVTAKVEEIDRLLGLELGADDYICKPYSPREVVARVKAVLRRFNHNSQATEDTFEQLTLDENKFSVELKEQAITLTSIEFRLFKLLHDEPGRIFSRQYIMDSIYTDYRVVSDRTVDSHIKKLRKKLQQLDENGEFIRSIYGAGYKFEPTI